MGVDAACERPIHIIESGPAAGVVGAAELAGKLGRRHVLTFDMGGTTAKAANNYRGRPLRSGQASHSASFDHRRSSTFPLTAIPIAFFWPTSTTIFFPLVMPVYSRFRRSIM